MKKRTQEKYYRRAAPPRRARPGMESRENAAEIQMFVPWMASDGTEKQGSFAYFLYLFMAARLASD